MYLMSPVDDPSTRAGGRAASAGHRRPGRAKTLEALAAVEVPTQTFLVDIHWVPRIAHAY